MVSFISKTLPGLTDPSSQITINPSVTPDVKLLISTGAGLPNGCSGVDGDVKLKSAVNKSAI